MEFGDTTGPGRARWHYLTALDAPQILVRGWSTKPRQPCGVCRDHENQDLVTTWQGPIPSGWAPRTGEYELVIRWCERHGLVDHEVVPEPGQHMLRARDVEPTSVRGWVTERNQPCWVCAADTATTWQGPAPYGLLSDPTVGQEVTWCGLHGRVNQRFVTADGDDYHAA